MNQTAFYTDERCYWHTGGEYVLIFPVEGWVQPAQHMGFAESPESKRRFKNLMDFSGLTDHLDVRTAPQVSDEEILAVHDASFITHFKQLSAEKGGDLGFRAPFNKGGYEIARLSAGLAKAALASVLDGVHKNAYSLSRPPGHHCTRTTPMGFCPLNNIAIAVNAMQQQKGLGKVAVVDWDVHHGNGTQDCFYDRADVLTISVHQNNNFPSNSGAPDELGEGAGLGYNINVPLMPGAGHREYLYTMERVVLPALARFQPEVIIVACGLDASGFDPLSRTLAYSETFRAMTRMMMQAADQLCQGRLVLVHEGGYSEAYVPFCGVAVMEELSGHKTEVVDPALNRFECQQPIDAYYQLQCQLVDEMAVMFQL